MDIIEKFNKVSEKYIEKENLKSSALILQKEYIKQLPITSNSTNADTRNIIIYDRLVNTG